MRTPLLPILLAAVATLIIAPGVPAQIYVPADYPLIQQAVDAASPGDVIVIKDLPGLQGPNPVIIDKPLSLVGDPEFELFAADCAGPGAGPHGGLYLAGPGSGTVRIIGLRVLWGQDCLYPPPAIAGGGFEAVHLYDANLIGTAGAQSGSGFSGAAIDLSVERLVVVDSSIVGGSIRSYNCSQPLADAGAAIRVVGGTVSVLNSTIQGGQGLLSFCCSCACPTDLSVLLGRGGPGVTTDELYQAFSNITGGQGASFYAYPQDATGTSVFCGQLPSGPALQVGSQVPITGELLVLQGDGLLHLGQDEWLTWSYPSSSSTMLNLFMTPGVGAPLQIKNGVLFLDPQFLALLGSYFPAQASVQLTVPVDTALLGVDLVLQAYSSADGLSTPIITAIVP